MKQEQKNPKNTKKIILIILGVILLNPVSLLVYGYVALDYYQLHKAQPKLENTFESLNIPNDCSLLTKESSSGGIDASASTTVIYKCDIDAQNLFNELAATYKPTKTIVAAGDHSFGDQEITNNFASNFYVRVNGSTLIFTMNKTESGSKNNEKMIHNDTEPNTNPVYLSIFLSS